MAVKSLDWVKNIISYLLLNNNIHQKYVIASIAVTNMYFCLCFDE